LGSLEVAVKRTAELAGLQGEPQVVETQKKLSVIELLRGEFLGKWEARFPSASVRLNYLFSM
jgi:hypothetical protein